MMKARDVFYQNDGEVTKNYYSLLSEKKPLGQIAVALFRAQKRSKRAKDYRRGKWKRAAYDVKNWSIGELCRLLLQTNIAWGWKRDPKTPGYEWVLYVELPEGYGQCSFHNPQRGLGPDFKSDWDGQHLSTDRIIAFCDYVFTGERREPPQNVDKPIPVSTTGSMFNYEDHK